MAKCAGITQAGTACKGIPIDGSGYCYVHHPDYAEARRRHGAKGGRIGGRGRPQNEIARLTSKLEQLAEDVLSGKVDRGRGAVAGQLLSYALGGLKIGLQAREQEEIVARLEMLEEENQRRKGDRAWAR
jgi:hypothetical protein